MQITTLNLKGCLIDQQLIEEEKPRHKIMKTYSYKNKWFVEIYESYNSRTNSRTRVFCNLLAADEAFRVIPTLATKYRIFSSMYEHKNVDALEYADLVKGM
jgi:hypothetical protein